MGKIPKYQQFEQKEQEELAFKKEHQAKFSFAVKANKLNPSELLEEFIKGHSHPLVKNRESWKEINRWIREKDKEVLNFLKIIFKQSDTFVNSYDNIKAVPHILYYYKKGEAKKRIEDWKPKRRHHTNQLKDLVDFLFLKYKVPAFLYKMFIGHYEGMELFFHITNGKPYKKFPFVPALKMTSKVYHHLFSTPEDYTYFQSFRRAQVLSIGGDERLANAILSSKLNDEHTTKQDEFWVGVIQTFIGTDMFNMDKIPEIIDYINAQKYQTKLIRGVATVPMPNFSMNGRTAQTLLKKSDDWHKEEAHNAKMIQQALNAERRGTGRYGRYKPTPPPNLTWNPKPIQNFSQTIQKKDQNTGKKIDVTYSIVQLTCTAQLVEEAAEMRNCVYSYVTSCHEGRSAIFSTREGSKKEGKRTLTIEVRNNEVVQARLPQNVRLKEGTLMDVLKTWATKERLTISRYAL